MVQNKQRNRKRKRETEDSKQPLSKKRKLTHSNSNKCQSLEPKITKKQPFQNIRIPVASPRRNKPYHRLPKTKRRHSLHYSAYPANNSNTNNNNNYDRDKKIKDDKDQDKDDNENEDDDLDLDSELSPESNSSTTPNDGYPSRLNKLQLRSQPSTPIRNFIIDSNREPLSQSAKRSHRIRRTTIISNKENNKTVINHNDNNNMETNIYSDCKQMPNLSSSQSIQFSPPPQLKIIPDTIHEKEQIHFEKQQQMKRTQKPKLEKSHVIVGVNNDENDNNGNDDDHHDTKHAFPSYNLYEIILFILIGVIVGFIVSFTVYHQTELKSKNELKYIQCEKCIRQKSILNDESNRLKEERWNMQNKIEICQRERDKLRSLRSLIEIDDVNNNDNNQKQECKAYKSKIDLLEHELGECNVEWGACQQLGRQKDALDKKRLAEIEQQKRKFTLCNDQLKRYKKAAKV